LVIAGMSAYNMQCCREGPEAIQETRQLIVKLHRLSAEIEAIRAKTGRLPKDETELVALRGKLLPPCSDNYPPSYYRDDRGGYSLNGYVTYFWGRGWGCVFCYYGSDAAQRLHVESF
jgi:hypothetical protein